AVVVAAAIGFPLFLQPNAGNCVKNATPQLPDAPMSQLPPGYGLSSLFTIWYPLLVSQYCLCAQLSSCPIVSTSN
ncbi:MAG: hypothetical protein KDA96_24075, partial [Planctomycetaceae bacterium]|nr:hypothetical protein [Planctomycetaceae bacterium]